MPDEPLYDPDRTPFEDLDLDDPAVVDAYFNHPTTNQLADDYGRAFRHKPAADQQRELSEAISQYEGYREDAADRLKELDSTAPEHAAIQRLVDALDGYIEAAKLRMLELD